MDKPSARRERAREIYETALRNYETVAAGIDQTIKAGRIPDTDQLRTARVAADNLSNARLWLLLVAL